MIVSGAAAQKPDFVVTDPGMSVKPPSPKEGDKLRVTVNVANAGAAAGTAEVVLYRDIVSPGTKLGTRTVTVAPDSSSPVSFDIASQGLDGDRRLIAEVDPEGKVPELVKVNNRASATVSIAGDYAHWGHGLTLEAQTGDAERLDEVVSLPVDLATVKGLPAVASSTRSRCAWSR